MFSSQERPSKRRRTSHGSIPNASDQSSGTPEVEEESDLLESPESSQEDNGESDDLATNRSHATSKLSRILKNCKPQETNFVTQIDQPASSPSALRGARWRKRSATPPSPAPVESISRPGTTQGPSLTEQQPNGVAQLNDDVDEEELAMAAAMLLSDDSEFESNSKPDRPATLTKRSVGPLRQTTLFGTQAQNKSAATQTKTHNWPLMSRAEPPTHHKLNYSACGTWVYPTNLGAIRDYQYNIVQKGLFHNLLVALPTGLGKTFIAATIMLNWFRWTEDSQIMFVAPTKPLVNQQVDACFRIAGIPRSVTVLLTGETRPAIRAEEYQTKRVFFLTPQTLIRDLQSGICDPKKVVLLVVDEAHKATGNFAYTEIVRFLNRFNSSFRVLALTATPGSTVETVQNVIDALNISRIEIRTEESLDIRQYVHSRNVDVQLLDDSEEVSMALELFSNSLQHTLDQLVSLGNAYWSRDPKALTAFGLTKARQTWMASDAARQAGFALKGKANAIFSVLASLAHAIELLRFHGIGSFYRNLRNFQIGTTDGSNNGKYAKEIANNENFTKLMNRLQGWVSNPDFIGHPKLSYVKNVVLNHFMDAGEGRGVADGRPPSDTRIMIFVHYRDSAEEITRTLKRHEPMIRPHVFVGQSASKSSEAMDQRKQGEVIDKFKRGVYNTLVATSIGEEGLDIGEVDLIVCYDSSSSPIRMLQRMGRTGRKRAGQIVLLLMKGKEEDSYIKAKDNYEKMQKIIAGGTRFTFTEDRSPRMIPKEIDPLVDKKVVEIPPENSQTISVVPKKRGRVPKMPPKKFHMPDDVETGFVQASILNGKPSRAAPLPKLDLDVASLPPLKSVLLTNSEESELNKKYRTLGRGSSQFVSRPRFGAFPVAQRTPRPINKVGHSRVTKNMVALLDTIQRPLRYSPLSSPEGTPRARIRDVSTERSKPSSREDTLVTQEDVGQSQLEIPSSNVMSSLASLSTMIRGKLSALPRSRPTGNSIVASTPDLDDALSEIENWMPSGSLPRRTKQAPLPQRRQVRVLDDSDDE